MSLAVILCSLYKAEMNLTLLKPWCVKAGPSLRMTHLLILRHRKTALASAPSPVLRLCLQPQSISTTLAQRRSSQMLTAIRRPRPSVHTERHRASVCSSVGWE